MIEIGKILAARFVLPSHQIFGFQVIYETRVPMFDHYMKTRKSDERRGGAALGQFVNGAKVMAAVPSISQPGSFSFCTE